MLVNKVTLLIDDMWLTELMSKMIAWVNEEEILQIIDKTEVEVCSDCQGYLSSDKEVIMDVYKCYYQQEYCLNCCGCEEHEGEKWY